MKASLLLLLYSFLRVIAEHHLDDIPVPKINEIKELSDKLLKNYSKHILPFEGPWPFVIDIYVYLVAVGDIDELHEKLSTVMRLEYEWRDNSFRWNDLEKNITYVTFGWKDVWKPVFRVTNPHADSINKHDVRSQDSVIYDSNGWAFFDEMMVTRTKCSLDMSFYPFDIQICTIKLGIVGDSKFHFKLNVYLEELISNSDAEHASWKLTETSTSSLYGSFEIVMKFERKPLFILLHILLPIIVLALLTPTVFLLTKKTGDRIGFSMTMLLALSIYMTIASNHLTNNAEPMPLILIMLFIWYTMDSVIIFVVIISAKIYRFKNERPRPDCVRRFVFITRVLMHNNAKHAIGNEPSEEKENISENGSDETDSQNEEGKIEQKVEYMSSDDVTWQEFSHCIDKWFLVVSYVIKVILPVVCLIVMEAQC